MFDTSKYSPNQRQAIEINDKHLRIIACAGSGKTTTIAGKVAYLLDPTNGFDLQPENIIAFTYTERAAAELKNKVLNQVGQLRGMANMYIGTIHGWCLKALQENEFEYQKYSVLDEIKLKLFIDKHYDKIGMKQIVKLSNSNIPLRRFVDTSLFVRIMDIIRESELAEGKNLPEYLISAKQSYEKTLIDKKYFDFSMIMEKALQSLTPESNLTKRITQNLKYLIVDEYQDVNPIQQQLITKLHKISNCIVSVVGDDDQNIYQWRGSNNKYIIDFHSNFKEENFKNIPLGMNYRSSIGITRLAETLISNNENRIPNKKMESANNQSFVKGQDILLNEYDDVEKENKAIAKYINSIIGVEFSDEEEEKRGIAYSDVAILLRTWNKAESIVKALEEEGIPYITAGVNQLFDTPEVSAALGVFRYLYGDISKGDLFNLWTRLPNNQIDRKKLRKGIHGLDKVDPKRSEIDKNWEYSLQDILWNFIEEGEIFEETFVDNKTLELEKRSKERAEILFFNLGKFSQVINDFEEVNFNSNSPSFHLFSFLSFVTYVARDYYPEGWINNSYKTPNAVQIMTIHQAKGLEFPVVVIPALNKNYLPVKKRGGLGVWHFLDRSLIKEQERYEGDHDTYEDERRLFYVAITRSQKYLLLTRAPDLSNRLYRRESLFLGELQKANVLVQDKRQDFRQVTKTESKAKEKIKNLTLDFSTLKAIFDCPYRFKLVSIFGFRFPLNQRMGLGRSFHNSLMEIHKRALEGENIEEDQLEEIIERQTHFPYLTSRKLKKSLPEKIRNNVIEYYEENKGSFNDIIFVEQDIQYKLSSDILVLGRIDLIKKKNDFGQYETTIIEFKSKEEMSLAKITREQLKLYALGHRELTGEVADYIMTYYIGEKPPIAKTPEKLYEEDLDEIEQKIKDAVEIIRNEDFKKVESKEKCDTCFQNSLCSYKIKYNAKNLR